MIDDEPLVSGLIDFETRLSPTEIMKALYEGKRLKLKGSPDDCSYWIEGNELVSDTLTYLKGTPLTWFNPDIHYVIVDD